MATDPADLILEVIRNKGPIRTREIRNVLEGAIGYPSAPTDYHGPLQRLQRLGLIERCKGHLFEREAPFQIAKPKTAKD